MLTNKQVEYIIKLQKTADMILNVIGEYLDDEGDKDKLAPIVAKLAKAIVVATE